MRAPNCRPGLPMMRVTTGELSTNTYLLGSPCDNAARRECVVIDPGLELRQLQDTLTEGSWRPTAVLCTHGHFDHVGGAAWLQEEFGVPVYLSAADLKIAKLSNFMMKAFGIRRSIRLPEFELIAADSSPIVCAGRSFIFHPLAGHTPGSAAIAVDDLLFSGDSLYAFHITLSTLPGEDHNELRVSLKHLLGWIGDEVLVMPGHGESATVAEIKMHNEELRRFLREEGES